VRADLRPLTQDEIRANFGDPTYYLGADGRVLPQWEVLTLDARDLPAPLPLQMNRSVMVTRFRCHHLVADHLEAALREAHANPEIWATINDWAGCYNFRPNRKDPRKLSIHCWGLGPDMDVNDNPQGAEPHVHPGLIEIMERHGFYWGGRFHGAAIDGMHWEFADLALLGKS